MSPCSRPEARACHSNGREEGKVAAPRRSGFDRFEKRALGREAGGDQPAAEAAAAVERDCVFALAQAAMAAIETADDAAEAVIGGLEFENIDPSPPQHIALEVERLARVDAGMDEEELAVLGDRRALQPGEELAMAGAGVDRGAQAGGPTGHGHGAVARGGEALPRIGAIGLKRLDHAVIEHPLQHFARIGRELKLEKLLPHLLLGTAEKGDIAEEDAALRQKQTAEGDELAERAGNVGPIAEIAAEIDEAIAFGQPSRKLGMERRQPRGVAMDGGDRPGAARPAEARENIGIAGGGGHARSRLGNAVE